MVGVPYFVISSIISEMYFDGILSPSIKTAIFVSFIIILKDSNIAHLIRTKIIYLFFDMAAFFLLIITWSNSNNKGVIPLNAFLHMKLSKSFVKLAYLLLLSISFFYLMQNTLAQKKKEK